MNSLKTQGEQFINNREGRAEGGREKPARFELKKGICNKIWEGMILGSNHFRKAREKKVDVTGLTDSCVKRQGKTSSIMQTESAKED